MKYVLGPMMILFAAYWFHKECKITISRDQILARARSHVARGTLHLFAESWIRFLAPVGLVIAGVTLIVFAFF